MVNDAPRFDAQQAARIARESFGIDGTAEPLPSERDQNFLLTNGSGARQVLKIANACDSDGDYRPGVGTCMGGDCPSSAECI